MVRALGMLIVLSLAAILAVAACSDNPLTHTVTLKLTVPKEKADPSQIVSVEAAGFRSINSGQVRGQFSGSGQYATMTWVFEDVPDAASYTISYLGIHTRTLSKAEMEKEGWTVHFFQSG